MREILFRGKRESDGKWIYGYYSDDKVYGTDFPCIFPLVEREDDEDWAVLPETVGQFTGLVDKNGEKIFEGDIVTSEEFRLNNEGCGVIVWRDDEAMFVVETYRYYDFDGTSGTELEVIGNIHDNPELIRGVEK